MYESPRYLLAGDRGLVIEFGNIIDKNINKRLTAMAKEIVRMDIRGIIEITPTYRSIQVIYDPMVIDYKYLIESLKKLERSIDMTSEDFNRIIEIPVVYGGEYGPDMEFVGNYKKLDIKDLIDIHSSKDYLVYMLGFTPGFGYLGGMDPRLETPRLENPRLKIPRGSLGIAGKQTGIYPIDSPGGWRIIGKTPLNLFDPKNNPPVFLNSGDYIRFLPIDKEEFLRVENLVKKNKYKVNIIEEGWTNGEN